MHRIRNPPAGLLDDDIGDLLDDQAMLQRRGGRVIVDRMPTRSLELDADALTATLERLQTDGRVPMEDHSLLVYVDNSHGEVGHPALVSLTRPRKGALGGVFASPPALYEVSGLADLSDAVLEVGAYGFVSVLQIPRHRLEDLIDLVRKKSFGVSTPNEPSPLSRLLSDGESFWEVSTCLESTPVGGGREVTFLVITYSDVPTPVAELLDSLGAGSGA